MSPETETKVIASLTHIVTVVNRLDHTVNGNGKPGLVVQVDRHEQSLKWLRRVGWAVLAPALAALGVGLLGLAQKQETPHEVSYPSPQPSAVHQSGGDARVQPVPGE